MLNVKPAENGPELSLPQLRLPRLETCAPVPTAQVAKNADSDSVEIAFLSLFFIAALRNAHQFVFRLRL